MHRTINDLCEKDGLKYDDYFKLLSLEDYSNLKHTLARVVRIASREEADKDQLTKRIQALGASPETSQMVATCLWVRKDEVRTQLVKDSCNIAQSKLVDFDWKLKVCRTKRNHSLVPRPVFYKLTCATRRPGPTYHVRVERR